MLPQYLVMAREQFAKENGWRVSKSSFDLDVLKRGGLHGKWKEHGVLPDHTEFFRMNRCAVAIVGHNYDGGFGRWEFDAKEFGLIVHDGGKAASWYYPGSTTLVVLTRPGFQVVWPTQEQIEETTAMHKHYYEQVRHHHAMKSA